MIPIVPGGRALPRGVQPFFSKNGRLQEGPGLGPGPRGPRRAIQEVSNRKPLPPPQSLTPASKSLPLQRARYDCRRNLPAAAIQLPLSQAAPTACFFCRLALVGATLAVARRSLVPAVMTQKIGTGAPKPTQPSHCRDQVTAVGRLLRIHERKERRIQRHPQTLRWGPGVAA